MSEIDDDPFARRDTRPHLGKTDRRESHRVDVKARIRLCTGDAELEACTGSVSLNGFFAEGTPFGEGDFTGQEAEVLIDLVEEGELTVKAPLRKPSKRVGVIVRFDSLDFEEERRIARFLDARIEE